MKKLKIPIYISISHLEKLIVECLSLLFQIAFVITYWNRIIAIGAIITVWYTTTSSDHVK